MNFEEAEYLRKTLPYGMWTTKTGEEVLFNRHYHPIWSRKQGEKEPTRFTETQWIKDIAQHDYFFNDGTSPFLKGKAAKQVESLLHNVLDVFISEKPIESIDNVWQYGKQGSRRVK